ncbi:unnamed protein product [Cochlearia groenlandica]
MYSKPLRNPSTSLGIKAIMNGMKALIRKIERTSTMPKDKVKVKEKGMATQGLTIKVSIGATTIYLIEEITWRTLKIKSTPPKNSKNQPITYVTKEGTKEAMTKGTIQHQLSSKPGKYR